MDKKTLLKPVKTKTSKNYRHFLTVVLTLKSKGMKTKVSELLGEIRYFFDNEDSCYAGMGKYYRALFAALNDDDRFWWQIIYNTK